MKQSIPERVRNKGFWVAAAAAVVVLVAMPLVVSAAGNDDEDEEDRARTAYRYTLAGEDGSKRAYLGVNIEEETDHPEGGALVTRVVEDSPADNAGLRKGDIIVGLEAEAIRGPGGLGKKLKEYEPGDTVAVKVIRDGKAQTLTVELGSRPGWSGVIVGDGRAWTVPYMDEERAEEYERLAEEYAERAQEWAREYQERAEEWAEEWAERYENEDWPERFNFRFAFAGRPKLGVQLVETTSELRDHLGGRDDAGVLVGRVLSDMPAEKAGMQVGDLIVSVKGTPVKSTGELVKALRDVSDETIEIEVVRDGRLLTLEVFVPEPEDDEIDGPRAMLVLPEMPAVPSMPALPAMPVLPEIRVAPVIEIDDEIRDEIRRQRQEVRLREREVRRALAEVERAALRDRREVEHRIRDEVREKIRDERRRIRGLNAI